MTQKPSCGVNGLAFFGKITKRYNASTGSDESTQQWFLKGATKNVIKVLLSGTKPFR